MLGGNVQAHSDDGLLKICRAEAKYGDASQSIADDKLESVVKSFGSRSRSALHSDVV